MYNLYIIQNQNSLIPGNYKLGYNLKNINGLLSNDATINLNISSNPLEINNIVTEKICSGTIAPVNYSFNLQYGIPEYSYSFNNSTYYPISGFHNINVTGSTTSSYNTLYIKDYLNNKY